LSDACKVKSRKRKWKIVERERADSAAAAAEGDIVEEMTVCHASPDRRNEGWLHSCLLL